MVFKLLCCCCNRLGKKTKSTKQKTSTIKYYPAGMSMMDLELMWCKPNDDKTIDSGAQLKEGGPIFYIDADQIFKKQDDNDEFDYDEVKDDQFRIVVIQEFHDNAIVMLKEEVLEEERLSRETLNDAVADFHSKEKASGMLPGFSKERVGESKEPTKENSKFGELSKVEAQDQLNSTQRKTEKDKDKDKDKDKHKEHKEKEKEKVPNKEKAKDGKEDSNHMKIEETQNSKSKSHAKLKAGGEKKEGKQK